MTEEGLFPQRDRIEAVRQGQQPQPRSVLGDLMSKAQILGQTELESDPGFRSALLTLDAQGMRPLQLSGDCANVLEQALPCNAQSDAAGAKWRGS
jgi:hypothetical protein